MKAIKDCEWEVRLIVQGKLSLGIRWEAHSEDMTGNAGDTFNSVWWASKSTAKRNWECFAKLNKIKKWRYV